MLGNKANDEDDAGHYWFNGKPKATASDGKPKATASDGKPKATWPLLV
jgi:hypothetical protein